MSDRLEELRGHVKQLNALLDDAHPGIGVWVKMYGEKMQAISDFWNNEPPTTGINNITYEAVNPAVKVFLKTGNRQKHIGTIKHLPDGGWAYSPKGHKPGETFPSLAACKRSLEEP